MEHLLSELDIQGRNLCKILCLFQVDTCERHTIDKRSDLFLLGNVLRRMVPMGKIEVVNFS